MSIQLKVAAEPRTEIGTRACRRLRNAGRIPANVYGHGQEPVAVTVSSDDARSMTQGGARVVELQLNGKPETTLLRDVSWNTFGTAVQHLDFLRVDASQRVEVVVKIQLRGTAAGAIAGGIVETPLHALHIECPALEVPEFISVKIAHLEIGQSIHVRELVDLPPGIVVKNAPDLVIVSIAKPKSEEELLKEEAAGAEPELIRKKKEEATAE